MPILTRVKVVLVCVAALSAVLWASWTYHLVGANKRLGDALEQAQQDLVTEQALRTAEHAVAVRYAVKLSALSTKQQATHATLATATRAAPAWSAERVPDAVADALGLPVDAPTPEADPTTR